MLGYGAFARVYLFIQHPTAAADKTLLGSFNLFPFLNLPTSIGNNVTWLILEIFATVTWDIILLPDPGNHLSFGLNTGLVLNSHLQATTTGAFFSTAIIGESAGKA